MPGPPLTAAPAAAPRRDELARRLAALSTPGDASLTPLDLGLEVMRVERPRSRTPVVYQPCLCIVAQGKKRAWIGTEALTYDPLHYLVLSVPLPVEGEIVEASPERPFLALRLSLDTAALGELMLDVGDDGIERRGNRAARRGIAVSPVDDALHGAVLRLLAALDDPRERRVLAPLAHREVLYRLLTGEQGDLLREVVLRDSRSQRIAEVLGFLQANYDLPLDVATIAETANMSPSTLHHAFKAVTSTSPVQYLKSIRLHQARLLMLHDGLGAGEAAHRVGYSSDSQFSREYRRLFGAPPGRDVTALREEALGG